MSIGEVCTREVVYVGMSESAAQAARLMRENHVGSLVVLEPAEAGGKPVGIVTDRDVTVGVVALALDPEDTPVEALMRPGVTCIGEHEGLGRAVALMRSQGVRRLPVVDAHGVLVGIVSSDDLLELLAEEMSNLAGMVGREFRRERDERVVPAH